ISTSGAYASAGVTRRRTPSRHTVAYSTRSPRARRMLSMSSISGSGAPRIHIRGDVLISVLLLDSRTHPLTRDLIRLTVLDRLEPLLAGISALSPGVGDPVAAAVRADLGDDDATTVAAHAALVPLVRSALRALGLVGRQLDGVSLAVERERHDLAILIERIGATPRPHVDPVRARALAPIAIVDILLGGGLARCGARIVDLRVAVVGIPAREYD